MNTHLYWPYDEVSLEIPGDSSIVLKTPWLKATTSAVPFNKEKLLELSTKLTEQRLSIKDAVFVNEFFTYFKQYPVSYILPTIKTEPLDKHYLIDHSLLEMSFEQVLEAILQPEFKKIDQSELLDLLPRKNWEWDQESALSFATINNFIHPESFWSIARRYHLLEIISSDRGTQISENLSQLPSEQSSMALARLVRQNHYVTEKCHDSLKPALALAGRAALLIETFMKEERGHDSILAKSLKYMNIEPKSIKVSVQTRALMHMLKYMAQRNFLAFSMAIDAFERNNYADKDPLAQLLIKAGFDKSARCINLHMIINEQGEHDNMAQKFIQFMDLCDQDYALEALRLMEILSLIMSCVSLSSLN